MATLLDFRRRIRSVKNTQQITRAMKFVAAARLRRAQEKVFAARPYARLMESVLRSVLARVESPIHPLMARRPEARVLVLLLSGDRGLCGAFNANVIRHAIEFLEKHRCRELTLAQEIICKAMGWDRSLEIRLIAVGRKGRDALRKHKWSFVAEYINVIARVEYAHAKQIAAQVIERYSAGEVDAVYAIYNEFRSVLVQRLKVEKLLPIEPDSLVPVVEELRREAAAGPEQAQAVDYIYEQPAAEIFDRLLPRYVETQVHRVMLESSAAEHAARMTAMDSATNNAAELIEHLTLHMNKVRQASITKEIIEVVSGAAWTV